jgi:hypothetical protein
MYFQKKIATFNLKHGRMKTLPGGLFLKKLFLFYFEGFKNMTVGKKLWVIILIKLFIIFVILKLFFFPDLLKKNFKTEEERSIYVIQELTKNTN